MHGWQCRLQGLCAAEWLQDEGERCLDTKGEVAVVRAGSWSWQVRRGLRVEVQVSFGGGDRKQGDLSGDRAEGGLK